MQMVNLELQRRHLPTAKRIPRILGLSITMSIVVVLEIWQLAQNSLAQTQTAKLSAGVEIVQVSLEMRGKHIASWGVIILHTTGLVSQ
jgi:hypothetical protein